MNKREENIETRSTWMFFEKFLDHRNERAWIV
jgi:hypothetical protein